MRVATGLAASALVIFLGGAVGSLGGWTLAVSSVLLLLGAVTAAVAMDERGTGAPAALTIVHSDAGPLAAPRRHAPFRSDAA